MTCGPVFFEIRRGLKPEDRTAVLSLFDALHRLAFEDDDWHSAGELDQSPRSQGATLPSMDLLIAHLALKHDITLLTLDKRFESVQGVRLSGECPGGGMPVKR